MRVLILSAFFAVAAAAPSGLYAPVLVPAIRTVAVPAVIPTISPGDIQAAAIDAQVQARDAAQAAVDKARELAEQAAENVNEKAITEATVANEQNLDAYWSTEDKKWQAVDALKTAEAKIDGIVANNANILAKSVVNGALPIVPAVGPISPIVTPISPLVYSSLVAPQSYSTQTLITAQAVQTETKEDNLNAAVKSAEPAKPAEAEKPAEQAEAQKTEAMESAGSPAVKAAQNLEEKPALIGQPLIVPQLGLYRYDVGVPAFGQVLGQPILNYAAVQSVNGVLTPTFVKTAW